MTDGVYGFLKSVVGGFAAVLCLGFLFGVGLAAGEYLGRWVISILIGLLIDHLAA